MWKVGGVVVSDNIILLCGLGFSDVRSSETPSSLPFPKSRVRPEFGVLEYVLKGESSLFKTGNSMGSLSLYLTAM